MLNRETLKCPEEYAAILIVSTHMWKELVLCANSQAHKAKLITYVIRMQQQQQSHTTLSKQLGCLWSQMTAQTVTSPPNSIRTK